MGRFLFYINWRSKTKSIRYRIGSSRAALLIGFFLERMQVYIIDLSIRAVFPTGLFFAAMILSRGHKMQQCAPNNVLPIIPYGSRNLRKKSIAHIFIHFSYTYVQFQKKKKIKIFELLSKWADFRYLKLFFTSIYPFHLLLLFIYSLIHCFFYLFNHFIL